MSVNQYYLAEDVFAYPSSNANDGGEDNAESNLKTFTGMIVAKNFVVMRRGVYQKYFNLRYSSNPLGVLITAGECCINSYYINLEDTVVKTQDASGSSLLKPSTKYNVVLRVYKDGLGHLRGDGLNLDKVLECRGVTASLVTDDELSELSLDTTLPLGDFVTDEGGNPPVSDGDYHLREDRFTFLSSLVIITSSGQNIEDWVNERISWELAHLSQLNYYQNPDDEEPSSTLKLTSDNKLIFEAGDVSFDIVEIENRTHVAESGQRTEVALANSEDNKNTYNGTSNLLARADHHHDGRYLTKTTQDSATQTVQTPVTVNGDLKVGSSVTIKSADGSISAAKNHFRVDSAGKVETDDSLVVAKSITASGDITGARVFNAVWNDYADALKVSPHCTRKIEPGDIICKSLDDEGYELSTYSLRRLVVGVCSDTYGHLLGGHPGKETVEESLRGYIPVAVAGNVRVKVKGPVYAGDFVTVSEIPGVGEAHEFYEQGTVVGKALEDKLDTGTDRVLIQVMLC